jgi:hypothetical protein
MLKTTFAMKNCKRISLFLAVPTLLILLTGIVVAQDPPDGPPDIEPTPFTGGTPFALGNVVIPPFNSAEAGATQLGDGQFVELQVITNVPNGAELQWKKDGEALPGITGPTLQIQQVSESDAGSYSVDVTFNNITNNSTTADFEVVPLSQLDDVFSSWTNRFFTFAELDDPDLSSDIADPDQDGIANVAEYFFGLNPRKQSQSPIIDITDFNSSSLSFTYPRTNERPDLFLTIQGSTTLSDWFSLPSNQMSVIPGNEDHELVQLGVDWPPLLPSNPKFLRLAIEQIEP